MAVWIDRQGKKWDTKDMSNQHLINTHNMLLRGISDFKLQLEFDQVPFDETPKHIETMNLWKAKKEDLEEEMNIRGLN